MDKRWHYLLEYIGALLCAFLANMEYSFSYMNGIHLFLWIIYFCMFLYFRETILYCFIYFFHDIYYFDIMDHWYNNKSSDCSYDF